MQGKQLYRGEPKALCAAKEPGAVNSQKAWINYRKLSFTCENQRQASRQSSVDCYTCEQNRDMVTRANPISHMVPEFLTGQSPMQPREPQQHQDSIIDESQDTVPPVLKTMNQTTPPDPLIVLQKCYSV